MSWIAWGSRACRRRVASRGEEAHVVNIFENLNIWKFVFQPLPKQNPTKHTYFIHSLWNVKARKPLISHKCSSFSCFKCIFNVRMVIHVLQRVWRTKRLLRHVAIFQSAISHCISDFDQQKLALPRDHVCSTKDPTVTLRQRSPSRTFQVRSRRGEGRKTPSNRVLGGPRITSAEVSARSKIGTEISLDCNLLNARHRRYRERINPNTNEFYDKSETRKKGRRRKVH